MRTLNEPQDTLGELKPITPAPKPQEDTFTQVSEHVVRNDRTGALETRDYRPGKAPQQ